MSDTNNPTPTGDNHENAMARGEHSQDTVPPPEHDSTRKEAKNRDE